MVNGLFQLSSGARILADGTQSGGNLEDVKLNGQRIIQESEICRAAWIAIFDRGNKRNEFDLKWSVVFASLCAATDAFAGFNDDLDGQADFKLSLSAGGLTWSGVMTGAGWKNPRATLIGATVIFECTVVGGQVLRTGTGFAAGSFYAALLLMVGGYGAPITISATGNDTLTPAAHTGPPDTGCTIFWQAIAVTAGSGGTYTHKVILDVTGRNAGDAIAISLALPLSANPTVEFRNATSGGTLIDSITSAADRARTFLYVFVFNGTAWTEFAAENLPTD